MLKKKFFARPMLGIVGDATVIFVNGNDAGRGTLKYSMPNGVSQAGTLLPAAQKYVTAMGNAVLGLFLSVDRTGCKYIYANDTIGNQVLLSGNDFEVMASCAGNATVGLLAKGAKFVSSYVNTADVVTYRYSDDVSSAGTSLSLAVYGTTSAGNKDFALFRLNSFSSGSSTDRFTYADDTRIAGPALSSFANGNAAGGSGTGNGTIGLIKGGRANTNAPTEINKIALAANTCTLGTNLTTGNQATSGMAGTTSVSVFGGPGGTAQPGSLYYYANDIVINTNTAVGGISGPGLCSNPVGVNV